MLSVRTTMYGTPLRNGCVQTQVVDGMMWLRMEKDVLRGEKRCPLRKRKFQATQPSEPWARTCTLGRLYLYRPTEYGTILLKSNVYTSMMLRQHTHWWGSCFAAPETVIGHRVRNPGNQRVALS